MLALFCQTGYSQILNEDVLRTIVDENPKKDKKVSYAFIAEHGMYLGYGIAYTDVFVNGICFNKTQDIIGVGVGAEFDIRYGLGIPIYAVVFTA